MKISKLLPSDHNPRKISQDNLNKLKKSLSSFQKMMEARPLIVTEDFRVIGGNQRLKVLIELGYDEIPDEWVKVMAFTPSEEREFIVKDNASYGSWDWDGLLEEFGQEELFEWTIEVPSLGDLEKVGVVNNLEDEEWVGMPDFEKGDDPLQIVVKFENEGLRKEFAEKMNIKFTYAKEGNKSWTTWYPYKEKGDWKSKKYE